ncbi:DUF6252 family protein [Dyadobacter frigoris]|uniref:Lipocalin-like domain-containing protein n=1 Tax=Dyadobacter frigoris TaxID=2576211 RepID=A0A4U6CWW2_9BACT|nr:DUF6252 family protein [Dyadobacter frigoris]TKT88147.1 hypothetical protein FDK13_27630 [Dyadobacter frigoris]GLU53763.1 hypothetical protein Dfri01_32240 [Dyadobacter frigoris]
MRKLAILFFALGIFSCKKDKESFAPENYLFSAEKNDEKWTGTTEISLQAPDSDTLTLLFKANNSNEVLWVKIKFNEIGSYPLKGNQAGYYSTVGGDVISSNYVMANGDVGHLTVTKYNPAQKLIEGTFDISLTKQYANPENNINILKFANGCFKWKLLK